MIVTIIRHGETYLNAQRVLQGSSDSALNETGEEQARQCGRAFATRNTTFTRAFASDLQRAYKTALLILGQLCTATPTIVKDVRIRERCFGDAEGRPSKEFAERAEQANININDFLPPGAETNEAVNQRAVSFFTDICCLSECANSAENILVVTHGGWINTLMRHFNSPNNTMFELRNFNPGKSIRIFGNTAVTELSVNPACGDSSGSGSRKYVVEFLRVNDTSHLNPATKFDCT